MCRQRHRSKRKAHDTSTNQLNQHRGDELRAPGNVVINTHAVMSPCDSDKIYRRNAQSDAVDGGTSITPSPNRSSKQHGARARGKRLAAGKASDQRQRPKRLKRRSTQGEVRTIGKHARQQRVRLPDARTVRSAHTLNAITRGHCEHHRPKEKNEDVRQPQHGN